MRPAVIATGAGAFSGREATGTSHSFAAEQLAFARQLAGSAGLR